MNSIEVTNLITNNLKFFINDENKLNYINKNLLLIINSYTNPNSIFDLFLSCISFFFLMITICSIVEYNNPKFNSSKKRWIQIKNELIESIPAVFTSTSTSILLIKYIYPLRWGHLMPVLPLSFQRFVFEFIYWMFMFEWAAYIIHRFMHLRKPINIYKYVHKQHHLDIKPTAFDAQAINPLEAILFAFSSMWGSLLFLNVSILTQYTCGILLLMWSIFGKNKYYI